MRKTVASAPRVSVVMSVHNGGQYLAEAIDSILSQTFTDFEFIIVDDGSSDLTFDTLAIYQKQDARIRAHHFEVRRGLSTALNFGIRLAHGCYIARMDADDISLPTRLQEQVLFLDGNPDVDICGTWVELFGARQGEKWQHPTTHDFIYSRMLFASAFAHPTVMLRTSSILETEMLYDEEVRYAQDYDLWSRAVSKLRMANLGRVLLRYRVHSQNASSLYRIDQIKIHETIHRRLFQNLKVYPSPDEMELHQKICNSQYEFTLSFLKASYRWFKRISLGNYRSRVIRSAVLDAELNMWWRQICHGVVFHPAFAPCLSWKCSLVLTGKLKKILYKILCAIKPGLQSGQIDLGSKAGDMT